MLLDGYLPTYDVLERHHRQVGASPEEVWEALETCDFSRSAVIRWLFRLRGMGGGSRPLTLRSLERWRFALLEEVPGRHVVLGIIGRFWKPAGDLQEIDRDSFLLGPRAGFARAAWSFEIESLGGGAARISTETRVEASDPTSRRRFLRYWRFIGPFSALIRRRMLSAVAHRALEISGRPTTALADRRPRT